MNYHDIIGKCIGPITSSIDYIRLYKECPDVFKDMLIEMLEIKRRKTDKMEAKNRKISSFEAIHLFKDDLYSICMQKIRNNEDVDVFQDILNKIRSFQTMNIHKARNVNIRALLESFGIKVNNRGFACCPFHEEKTASFKIFDNSNRYRCFGCDKYGDSIQLMRDYKKMDFKESVQFLTSF